MSENMKYPIDIIQDVMTYPELQDITLTTKNEVQALQKKVDGLNTSGGSAEIGFVVADQNSTSNANFIPGKMGLVQIYNRSGGLEVRELKNGDINYGPRLFVACAGRSEIKYGEGNANNPVSAELFQYAMKVNSYKDEFMLKPFKDDDGQIPPSAAKVKEAITAAKSSATNEAISAAKSYTDQKSQDNFANLNNKITSINSRLSVKVKVLPKGDTTGWTIPPSTFAILSTYGAKFTGTEKYDDGGSNNQSYNLSDLCIIYSSEKFKVNDNDVYRCFVVYPKNFSLGYDQRQFAAGSCKLQNTYAGNDGTGATHIQYITFSAET